MSNHGPEVREISMAQLTGVAAEWQSTGQAIAESLKRSGGDFKAHWSDPQTWILTDSYRELTRIMEANHRVIVSEANPEAFSRVAEGLASKESGFSARIVQRMGRIPPDIARAQIAEELHAHSREIAGGFGGFEFSDYAIEILAGLVLNTKDPSNPQTP